MSATIRRSFQQSVLEAKIVAKHRAGMSLAVPSRATTDYMGDNKYDAEDSNFLDARKIIALNHRYE